MNDLEKIASGRWCHAITPESGRALLRTEELLFGFNSLAPSRREEREAILRALLAHLGTGCVIHSPFRCDFGDRISIGDRFVGNFGLTILDEAAVTIGDRVFIGPDVGLYTVAHALLPDQRAEGVMRARPIVIGNDVWIGGHSVLLPGVRIGDGAVIGAGSVVTHDIPPRTLAFGNPCRPQRPITEVDRIPAEEIL